MLRQMSGNEISESGPKESTGGGQKRPRSRHDSLKDGGIQTLLANSNSTMHAFMGGRPKSWMTTGTSPTVSSPAGKSLTFARATAGSSAIVARQSVSKPVSAPSQGHVPLTAIPPPLSTEPVKSHSTPVGSASQESVLPSPAPSDDVASPSAPTFNEIQTGVLGEHSGGTAEEPTHTSTRESIDGFNHGNRPVPSDGCAQIAQTSDRTPLFAEPRDHHEAEGRANPRSADDHDTNVVQFAANQQNTPSHQDHPQNKRRRLGATWERPEASSSQVSGGAIVAASTIPRPNPVRSSSPTLKDYLPRIAAHIQESGGAQAIAGSRDMYRIGLLENACLNEDCFFLALHQLFCLETLQPGNLMALDGFGPEEKSGLDFIKYLLGPNELFSRARLQWFAAFPSPFEHLARVSKLYRHAIGQVQIFLRVVPVQWSKLYELCLRRDCPPLASEMVQDLKMLSVTTQKCYFTLLHRIMWGAKDDEWYRATEDNFLRDQAQYYDVIYRMNTSSPVPIPQAHELVRQIKTTYMQLRSAQLRAARSLGSSNPEASSNPPTAPSQTANPHEASQVIVPHHQGFTTPSSGRARTTSYNQPRPQQLPSRLHINIPSTQPPTFLASPPSTTTAQFPTPPSGAFQTPPTFSIPHVPSTRINQAQVRPGIRSAPQQPIPGNPPHQVYGPSAAEAPPRYNYPTSSYLNSPPTASFSAVTPAGLAQTPILPSHRSTVPSQRPIVSQQTPRQVVSASFGNPGALGARRQDVSEHPLIPTRPTTAVMNQPNPTIMALHQAYLRSPRLVPLDEHGKESKSNRLYRVVKGFACPPYLMNEDCLIWRLPFAISKEDSLQLPKPHEWPSIDQLPAASVHEGTLMYRVRSCVLDTAMGSCDESQWLVKDVVWPEHIFIDANEESLEVRRKYHQGKDLEVDITGFVNEGHNLVSGVIFRTTKEKEIRYAVAVEVIEFSTHATLMRTCQERTPIPADQTLSEIIASLTSDPLDDELAIVNSQVVISVTDPFMARIFNIPVRGVSCVHHDCFDLETFLLTRRLAGETPTAAHPLITKVDEWRCPLCGADARPQMLRIDGFLLQVRKTLEQNNQLDTKAIVVRKDGTWVPKPQSKESSESNNIAAPSSENVGQATFGSQNAQLAPRTAGAKKRTIIELDD